MAFYQIYEGAVYMNNGLKFIISQMDVSKRIAHCGDPVNVDYYTSVRDMGRIITQVCVCVCMCLNYTCVCV